jgi:hypothetical protein
MTSQQCSNCYYKSLIIHYRSSMSITCLILTRHKWNIISVASSLGVCLQYYSANIHITILRDETCSLWLYWVCFIYSVFLYSILFCLIYVLIVLYMFTALLLSTCLPLMDSFRFWYSLLSLMFFFFRHEIAQTSELSRYVSFQREPKVS